MLLFFLRNFSNINLNKSIASMVMSYLMIALISTVECQRPGYPPTQAPEEEEVDDIGPFKRFLHKFGVDLDPSDVIVGLLLIAGISCAGFYF